MRNRMYGGVRGRKTRVGEKLHRFPPTRFESVRFGMVVYLTIVGYHFISITRQGPS